MHMYVRMAELFHFPVYILLSPLIQHLLLLLLVLCVNIWHCMIHMSELWNLLPHYSTLVLSVAILLVSLVILFFWSVWMCKFFGFLTEPDTAGALRSILMALVDPLKFACVE